jgi:hypothetical protein
VLASGHSSGKREEKAEVAPRPVIFE